ncbi:MAG TPA: response regulator [Methanospirillum sp.]|nr:response regulator [Methanospirillum sp.]
MTAGNRILIVEDEMVISLEIAGTLRRLKYEVAGQAITGADAIRLAGEADPDLVLMDIRLKGEMDGIEAARVIREQYDIPVIFLTAHSDEGTLERAISVSPSGYLIKPFKDRELYSTIELAIHKSDIRRRIRPEREVPAGIQDDILHTTTDPAIVISCRGIVIRANSQAFALFGTGPGEIVGTRISGWFSRDDAALSISSVPSGSIMPENLCLRRQDGTLLPLHAHAGFMLGDDGLVQGYIFTLHQNLLHSSSLN